MGENPNPSRSRLQSYVWTLFVAFVVAAWFCLFAKGCTEYMKHPMPIPKDEQ